MRLRHSLVAIVAIVGGGAFAVTRRSAPAAREAVVPAVPVVAGKVASQDVPIYLRGIGTVIAYNTDIAWPFSITLRLAMRSTPKRARKVPPPSFTGRLVL